MFSVYFPTTSPVSFENVRGNEYVPENEHTQ